MPITLNELSNRLDQLGVTLTQSIQLSLVGIPTLRLAEKIQERVTKQGLNSEGRPIGQYSTKPIYATRSEFVKPGAFSAQGKLPQKALTPQTFNAKGQSGLKTISGTVGKSKKVMYLPQGYKQLREIQGLEAGFVNVDYTGSLKNDFHPQLEGNTGVIGFTNPVQIEKRKELDAKFKGAIWYPTQQEAKETEENITFIAGKLLRGILMQGENVEATLTIGQ